MCCGNDAVKKTSEIKVKAGSSLAPTFVNMTTKGNGNKDVVIKSGKK